MRKIIIIVILSISSPLFSQTALNGKFEMISHENILFWEKDFFWFDSTGSFKFIRGTDEGSFIGHGKYIIKENELLLDFDNPDTTMPHVMDDYVVKKVNNYQNSMIYKITVLDNETGEPLVGATASINLNVSSLKDKPLVIAETDINGNLILNFGKNLIPGRLDVSYIGYYFFSYNIADSLSRDLEVRLSANKYPLSWFYTDKDSISFNFEYLSQDKFHLKRRDSDIKDWFLYKKTGEYNDK